MEKTYFVYMTKNIINGKKYIGQHFGMLTDQYLGTGTLLTKAIIKYGKENFERVVLEICDNKDELDIAEIKWIDVFDATNNKEFYNLTKGGTGGNTLQYLSDSELKERTDKFKNWLSGMTEDEYQNYIRRKSEAMKKVRKNTETELKRINSLKITNSGKSKEQKQKEYASRSGSNNKNSKTVKTPIGIFETAKQAAEVYKVSITTITNRCKNENFTEWEIIANE